MNFNTFLHHITLTLLILGLSQDVFSQLTKVKGTVIDSKTKEPLPFVNISFSNSLVGTTTDFNGTYKLETKFPTDSIVASFVGYNQQILAISKNSDQIINIEMNGTSVELEAVEIRGDVKDNPAHPIIRRVIQNKKQHNREKLTSYQYETYNKLEFDLNNITEDFKKRKIYKPFAFVFENIDSSEKKPFLPLFLTETISEVYYRKSPKSKKEVVKATKVSGIKNESVGQFMGDMYQNMNIYDNYINAFNISFVSPVADFGLLSYKYYLMDSVGIDDDFCYHIRFIPKRKQEMMFKGDIWIDAKSFAIKKVEATIAEDANINWIEEFSLEQIYDQVDEDGNWMLVHDHLVVDFTVSNSAAGFYGRKSTSYRNFKINEPRENSFYLGLDDIKVEDDANDKSTEYWNANRHETLNASEKQIYTMIDTIKTMPAFKTYVDIIQLFVTGYKVLGKVEIGPYFTMYSFNQIEGSRFRFGMRTSNDFSTKLMLEGYVAYGLKDQEFKYGFGADYFISKKPRQYIGFSYKQDVEQLGQGLNAWRSDNIISSVFRRNPNNKLNGFEEYEVHYNYEWFEGLSNQIDLKRRTIWPLGSLSFTVNDGLTRDTIDQITSSEVTLSTRFAFKEKFVSGEFERVSLGTKWPVLQIRYTAGLKGVLESDYNYHKLVVNVQDKIWTNPFGYSNVVLEGGKVFGNVPYPLLELHNGNETYSYDPTAFNLMNFYEFVSDEYASLALTHHFNGFFLNKVPLIRKLKLRELVTGKAVTGRLSRENRKLLDLPPTLSNLRRPYYEAGVGLENILKVLRIDFLWRLAYTDNEYINKYESFPFSNNIAKWGIRGTLQVSF